MLKNNSFVIEICRISAVRRRRACAVYLALCVIDGYNDFFFSYYTCYRWNNNRRVVKIIRIKIARRIINKANVENESIIIIIVKNKKKKMFTPVRLTSSGNRAPCLCSGVAI